MNASCPICGNGILSKKVLETVDIMTGEAFNLIECSICGVRRTDPIPDNMSSYYDTTLGRLMKADPNRVYSFFKNILLKAELARIRKRTGIKQVLDVGCGAGDFSKVLYEKGYRVVAADSCAEKPPYLSGTGISYHRIDYDSYAIKDFECAKGTIVILRHLLEHIRDPEVFVKRMVGYGGEIFYVVVPNASSMKSRLFGQYSWLLDPPRHIWHFNKRAMAAFFDRLGFEIIGSGYDTIPMFIPSLYRFMRIKRYPERIYRYFEPKSIVTTLSLPLDWILPRDIMWFIAKRA